MESIVWFYRVGHHDVNLKERAMLSLDQFLRLISLPAIVAALLIGSHISAAVNAAPAPTHRAGK